MGSVHRASYWLYDVVSDDVQKSLAIRSMAAYWCRCCIFIKLSSLNEQAYHVEIFSDTMMWNWIENRILVLNINFKIRLLKDEQHQINYLNCDQTLKRYMIYDMITTLRMWMLWWTSMWLCSTYWRAPLWHGSNYHINVTILFLWADPNQAKISENHLCICRHICNRHIYCNLILHFWFSWIHQNGLLGADFVLHQLKTWPKRWISLYTKRYITDKFPRWIYTPVVKS